MRRKVVYRVITSLIILAPLFFITTSKIDAGQLKDEAENYRQKGYEAQMAGDLDTAVTWYRKAAGLDPNYAAPHNDLGILYETKGWLERAEAEYQKALAIDPDYKNAHTNLALLYERKGELEKAAFHWMRRYKLGKPGNPWTEEAKERLEKLGLIEKKEKAKKVLPSQEQEVKKLPRKIVKKKEKIKVEKEKLEAKKEQPGLPKKETKEIKKKRISLKTDGWTRLGSKPRSRKKIKARPAKKDIDAELKRSLRLAEQRLREERKKKEKGVTKEYKKKASLATQPAIKHYYDEAETYYKRGEYSRALDTIRIAKKRYPEEQSLLDLEQTIKTKMKEERIEDHYNEAMMYYQQKDYKSARKEIEAILNILPE